MFKVLAYLLPFRFFLWAGRRLGEISFILARDKRQIVLKNLEKAFPDFSPEQIKSLALKHFRSLGMGLVESLYIWNSNGENLKPLAKVQGLDNLPDDKGALLMFFHTTSLEIGGILLALFTPLSAVYRKQNNSKFNHKMEKGRRKFLQSIIGSEDLRTLLKHLKQHKKVLYASDQHSTRGNWTFVDFFGQKTAVTTAASRIARTSKIQVLPLSIRREKSTYRITIYPAFKNFGDNPKQDAQTMMNWVEKEVRQVPEQYFWVHNIFKPAPKDSYDRLIP